MSEEEQERLYELLFKDTKNKLEETIEKLRIANAELRDELDKKNSEIEKQQKEIEELKAFYNSFESGEIVNYPIFKQRYISKDKIREKIEECKINLEWIKNGEEFANEEPMYYWWKIALEELLEEE